MIWLKERFPRYCFEVEHTAGVTMGLLRPYRLRLLDVKFLVITPSENVGRFKAEMAKDPFCKVRDGYNCGSYGELLDC